MAKDGTVTVKRRDTSGPWGNEVGNNGQQLIGMTEFREAARWGRSVEIGVNADDLCRAIWILVESKQT